MVKFERLSARALIVAALSVLALGLAACGSSSSNSSSSSSSGGSSSSGSSVKDGGAITILMGTAPDYLDPSEGYTTQAAEADWITYTGLLTYKHASGEEGGTLIPGLATALPQISSDGLTYTLTLRKGLTFSNGKPVKASDFTYSIERMLKLNWGGKSFVTGYVTGAAAFDTGKAKTISGIKTDDASGKITIHLDKAYGAFSNVLAFPSAGILPTGTAMKNLSNNPPPGVGPYMITSVVPNQSFTLKKNPAFAKFNIPDIPVGHLDTINVKIVSNTQSEAQQVLSGSADVFDAGDTIPPALLPQINSQASDRFQKQTIPSTFYMFLNTRMPPFNNQLAREAVNVGVDRRAFQRLASGFLAPSCYFLPEGIVGHPTGDCKYGNLAAPDIAKARQLLQQSGQMGAKVTVWGETREPRKEYMDYYTSALNKIGFKASEKIIADATYFPTIGNAKTAPQTGFADWIQDFPNPSDFYLLLDANSIQPTNNENFGNVNDPHIQSELAVLNKSPATNLAKDAARWQALDEYVASKAYVFVFGSEQVPQFFGPKINKDAAIFHRTYLNDWTSLALK
ncbi:MAG: extracellular solute-binding protein family 5 [Solirubrobacteraceae bacterium]|nr:extracellular solute-binding protein family 5 [Solirubrobacteraceae bacterium]